jgi:hypothetical protein
MARGAAARALLPVLVQMWIRDQGQSAVPARTREPCACGCQRLFFPAVANLLGKLRSKLVWRSMVSAATKARY